MLVLLEALREGSTVCDYHICRGRSGNVMLQKPFENQRVALQRMAKGVLPLGMGSMEGC